MKLNKTHNFIKALCSVESAPKKPFLSFIVNIIKIKVNKNKNYFIGMNFYNTNKSTLIVIISYNYIDNIAK